MRGTQSHFAGVYACWEAVGQGETDPTPGRPLMLEMPDGARVVGERAEREGRRPSNARDVVWHSCPC
ncbi:MAG: hypothetical protein R6U98_14410 [Pirellulaceae bacterium]